jgi:hypothetical protein
MGAAVIHPETDSTGAGRPLGNSGLRNSGCVEARYAIASRAQRTIEAFAALYHDVDGLKERSMKVGDHFRLALRNTGHIPLELGVRERIRVPGLNVDSEYVAERTRFFEQSGRGVAPHKLVDGRGEAG